MTREPGKQKQRPTFYVAMGLVALFAAFAP